MTTTTTIDASAVAATLRAMGLNADYIPPTEGRYGAIAVVPIGEPGLVWLHIVRPDAHDSAGASGYALRIVHEWMRAIQGGVR